MHPTLFQKLKNDYRHCLVVEIKKFRTKKLLKNQEKIIYIKNYLNNNLTYTYYFYKIFLF